MSVSSPELTSGRRLFVAALLPGPVLVLALAISLLVTGGGNVEAGTVWSAVLWTAAAAGFLLYGFAKRNAPSSWPKIIKVGTYFFGGLTGIVAILLAVDNGAPVAGGIALGVGVFLVAGVLPWVAVRRAAGKVIAQPVAAMAESAAELSFPLRGEDDGWFLVGQDEVRVRIRRRIRRSFDDTHDDRVDFTGIRELELVDLRGQETTHVGLGYEAHATDGPAVRLLILSDSRSDEPEEWVVAIDRAWEAIQAIETRRRQV